MRLVRWLSIGAVVVSSTVAIGVAATGGLALAAYLLFTGCSDTMLAEATSPDLGYTARLVKRDCNVTTRPMMLVVVRSRLPLVGLLTSEEPLAMDTMENPSVVQISWEDQHTLVIKGSSRGRVIWQKPTAGAINVRYR